MTVVAEFELSFRTTFDLICVVVVPVMSLPTRARILMTVFHVEPCAR